MTYAISTFPFAGIYFDGILDTETGETFLSASSIASALSKDESSARQFLASKQPEAAPYKHSKPGKIKLGRQTYSLIPTAAAAAYFSYWARKGNQDAIILNQATLAAEFARSVKETNGVTVTAAQHEETRAAIRHGLIQQRIHWVEEVYQVERSKLLALADQCETEAEYREKVEPLLDALNAQKAAIKSPTVGSAFYLTDDEYQEYVKQRQRQNQSQSVGW